MNRNRSRALAVGIGVLLAAQAATATEPAPYPSKSIRLVVPYPPGGAADSMVRLVLPRLSANLGQTVVVENRAGAGGSLGVSMVAKAPADGYTLALGAAGSLAANISLYPQMPYDPIKDLRPVGMLAATPFVIVGIPSASPHTLKELIALAKARPGALSIGHGGSGTAMHLSVALLRQMAAIDVVDVPYRGNGPTTIDVLSGHLAFAVIDVSASLQYIKAGKLIAYAVTSAQRLTMLPTVPTVAEAGVPGYESTGWFGLVAPAGTPNSVVAKLNAALNAALADEQIKLRMRELGAQAAPDSPKAFEDYIQAETKKWAKVIKSANIKLE